MRQNLSIVFILATTFCCQNEMRNERYVPGRGFKIKMIMESLHDPMLKDGQFQNSKKLSKNSLFYESYFDENGRLLRKNTFNYKALLVSKAVFIYDAHGNNTETRTSYSDKSLSSTSVRKFDAEGRLINLHEHDAFGKLLKKKLATRDSLGHRVITSYEQSNGRARKNIRMCV